MSDNNQEAFLRQRRNLVLISSVLLVYTGAEMKLTTFNGGVVSGHINNESFLLDFMLVLIGYFLIRFFQAMQSKYTEFTQEWRGAVKSRAKRLVCVELAKILGYGENSYVRIKDVEIEGSKVLVHVIRVVAEEPPVGKFNPCLFSYEGEILSVDDGAPNKIDVIRINKNLARKYWVVSWFCISWRTELLTEYYLPVFYSAGVVWWYVFVKVI